MKTTSFEVSKKLKEIGFKVTADYAYGNDGFKYVIGRFHDLVEEFYYNTYDLETILNELPKKIRYADKEAPMKYDRELEFWDFQMDKKSLYYIRHDYDIEYIVLCHEKQENESLADTAARLLILLESKNLVKFNKEKDDK